MAKSSKDIQLIELKDMISQLNTTIKTLTETLNNQQAENDNLKAELAWFRQKYFDASSERFPEVMFRNPCWHISFIGSMECISLFIARNRTSCR